MSQKEGRPITSLGLVSLLSNLDVNFTYNLRCVSSFSIDFKEASKLLLYASLNYLTP